MNLFVYYRNTQDRVHLEREAEVMDKMDEDKEEIAYGDFIQGLDTLGFSEIVANLGYGDDLKVEEDWSVNFYESKYGSLPCRIFSHTACDFIFLRREDAKMLAEAHDPDCSDVEWRRATSFGKGEVFEKPVDPRNGYFED